MSQDTLLKANINYEYFAEVNKPIDPIQLICANSKTLEELTSKLTKFKEVLSRQYPEYVDFYYKFNYTHPSKGCYSAWFDLYGSKKER